MNTCISYHINRIKVYFYIFIAISSIHNLAVPTVAGDVEETTSIQATQFWSQFSERFLYSVRRESVLTNKADIILKAANFVSANKNDRFACKALYDLALESYKAGCFSNSIDLSYQALLLSQTLPGDHLLLWNLIAESHKGNSNYRDAVLACDKILLMSGPDILVHDLHQAAITRKADLMLMSTNLSNEDRQKVEKLLKPLTEIVFSGSMSAPRGQLVCGRVRNLKKLGQVHDAFEVGRDFVIRNPFDYYSPSIAADLCALTNRLISVEDAEYWVRFFVAKNATNTAAFANLKMDLMNAHARIGNFEITTKLAEELSRFRPAPDDPLPWSSSHLEEVDNLKVLSQGEVLRGKQTRLLPTGPKAKIERWIVVSFLGLCSFISIVIIFRTVGCSRPKDIDG
jgi:hypothetical protein